MPIALLTDFGTRDYFVAAMKGAVLSIDPKALIVDITHDIAPQAVLEAAFTLNACYRDFPLGTIFTVVVDPGVGSERRAIAAESDGYYFAGPDNGVLSFVLGPNARVFGLENAEFFAKKVSATFHGRDIFAPAAAHMSLGFDPSAFGPRVKDPILLEQRIPKHDDTEVLTGCVLHIDRFGNIITNFKRSDMPESGHLEVNGTRIANFRRYFADGPAGELFLIEGSAGLVEIASYGASAAEITGAKAAMPVRVAASAG